MSEHGWLMGQHVTVLVIGEEHGWDEDRGHPEMVEADRLVRGRIDRVGSVDVFGETQIRLITGTGEDGPETLWSFVALIRKIHTPCDDMPHTAEMEN